MTTVIGLTGKVCAGKDAYARAFAECGAQLIDVDKLGHQVLEEQQEAIVKAFGSAIVVDGAVDRVALGQLVFANRTKLRSLEAIVHPAMVEHIKKLIAGASRSKIVINAALLQRMGLTELCDRVIFIKAPLWLRYLRCRKRKNFSVRSFLARNRAQKDIDSRTLNGRAELQVFHNRGSMALIHRQVASYCDTMDADLSTKR